jgi:transcriptional regulator with XRE-family HTH domain
MGSDRGSVREGVGRRVRLLRLQRRLTQEDLAHEAGLDSKYLSEFERGNENISIENLAKLARALGTGLPGLLRDDARRPPPAPTLDPLARRAVELVRSVNSRRRRLMLRLMEAVAEDERRR